MNLATSLSTIKGVGPKTFEQLEAADLKTVEDLLLFLPRKHEDFSEVLPIDRINPGKVTIKARVESVSTKFVRRSMRITTAVLVDDSGKLNAVWFNQPYRESQLKGGAEFFFSGNFEFRYNRYQLTSPSAEKVTDMPVQTDRLLPIYPSIKGLKSQLVRKLLIELKPLMSMLPETLPEDIVKNEKLLSYSQALVGMHFPETSQDIERARERLSFEELFQLLVSSQLNKQANSRLEGWKISFDVELMRQAVSELPFALTNAQRKVLWQIVQDFEQSEPMNRLLQGDVGSGKTVVAGLAALQAARAGLQSAIMAPTEILASQHAETLNALLSPFDIAVGLATGSVKGKVRQTLYRQIAAGEVDVVIGTHALIQDEMKFAKLGFVVVDEQHRFGVEQRQKLLLKSENMPHMLAMSATPIPRSLALTVYGDLAMSVLDEKPAGRRKVETKLWSPHSRTQLYAKLEEQLAAGRQGYVICKLIDSKPSSDKKSVETEVQRLKYVLPGRSVAALHGRMAADDKQSMMNQFAEGKIDVLVSTTVVEVGVNVANATVMIVEDADQYGLSQLHQLRGRVGRSEHQSYCYLVMSSSAKPSQRLREIEQSEDGFYLAEVDLKLRGPGEIYGRSQHGALNLQVATLGDSKLIARATRQAEQFVRYGENLLKYKRLASAVEKYQRLTTLN